MNSIRNTKSFLLLLNTRAFSFPVCNFCKFFPYIPYGHLVDVKGSVSGSITQCSDYISHLSSRNNLIPTAAAGGRAGVVCRKKISCRKKITAQNHPDHFHQDARIFCFQNCPSQFSEHALDRDV